MGRFRGGRSALWGTVLVAALTLFLLANPFELPSARVSSSANEARANAPVDSLLDPTLSIVLPQFPREGTTDLSLDASWGPAPPGCVVRPGWATWFLPSPEAAGGLFATPDASHTEFVPANLSSATSTVGVRSDAELSCGGSNRTVQGVAYSNVTTYSSLTLSDLSADPSATAAPGEVHLSGVVGGGRAPYLLGIDWGDASFTNETLPAAGSFHLTHTFAAGDFRPRVGVYDADRIDVRGSVPEPVEVSNETVLAINSSLPLAEVGVPVEFQGSYQRPLDHFGAVIGCVPDPTLRPQEYVTNVTCTPTTAGLLGVTLKVGSPAPELVVQDTREQPVAPRLDLLVRPVTSSLDAHVRTYVCITVLGGVPPFEVTWGTSNGTLGNRSGAPADGSFLVPWTPPIEGSATLNGSVRDSLGVSADSARVKLIVNATPTLALRADSEVGTSATTVEVFASLVGGSATAFWGLGVDTEPATQTSPVGETTNGSFDWTAVFRVEGAVTVEIATEDAASAWLTANLTIGLPVPPTLEVSSQTSNSTGTLQIELTWTVVGGVPPLSIWINSSGVELWNGSEATPGTYVEAVSPGNASLAIVLSVALVDARGVRAAGNVAVNLTASLPAPPASAPILVGGSGAELSPWVGAVVLVPLGGWIAWTFWRRRARPDDFTPPDAAYVLERLLRPADGADRLTIELMAEEEGVPLEVVRDTLDRLIREGRVRSESDPGAGEVLAWAVD